jgi:hypothetical protein
MPRGSKIAAGVRSSVGGTEAYLLRHGATKATKATNTAVKMDASLSRAHHCKRVSTRAEYKPEYDHIYLARRRRMQVQKPLFLANAARDRYGINIATKPSKHLMNKFSSGNNQGFGAGKTLLGTKTCWVLVKVPYVETSFRRRGGNRLGLEHKAYRKPEVDPVPS